MTDALTAHLQAIYDREGRVTPLLVYEAAEDPAHPLHDRVFYDSDADAAKEARLARCHDLIRKAKIVRVRDGKPIEVRAFPAVRLGEGSENGGYVYEPAERIALDDVARRVLLADMEREWKTLKRRYQDFAEFAEMIREDAMVAS